MPRSYEQIVSELNRLEPRDFDLNDVDSRGQEVLIELTDELMALPNPERAIPELLKVMERLPDSDLGSPGPLVHTLESLGDYEQELIRSVRRHPTYLSVWMVNRILNGMLFGKLPASDRELYLSLLQETAKHPLANRQTREDAVAFLERFARLGEQDQS